jgi:hypothetical protein
MADHYLLQYTVLDAVYQNGSHKIITGDDAGAAGNFGSIQNPADTGVPTAPLDPPVDPSLSKDPVVFSYAYNGYVRVLLGKIVTARHPASPSVCYYTLVSPPNPGSAPWNPPAANILATDVALQYPAGTNAATNPHGIAQVGDWLYIVDYDTQKITILGTDELNGVNPPTPPPPVVNYTLAKAPFDLGPNGEDALPSDAKGQAIIALKGSDGTNYLFALYIVGNASGTTYSASILVRMTVNADGSLTYKDKVNVGLNATEIIPVADTAAPGGIRLVIPAIGGYQNNGTTNDTNSNIMSVPAFASTLTATVLLTGDPVASPLTAFDLRAIAAPRPGSSRDTVYILTGSYSATWNQSWNLYETSISRLLSAGGKTISQAIAGNVMSSVDGNANDSGYYWDILYENTPGTANVVDRLWFLRGSPILINAAGSYSSAGGKFFDVGTAADQIGGQNVNSADLIAETLSQAAAGLSLKRSLRGHVAPSVRAAIQKAAEEEQKK